MMARLAALVTVLALLTPVGARAGETIVIEATRVVPDFLETTTGARVDLLDRAQRSVHVEFGADPRQHEVVQVPATGPIWGGLPPAGNASLRRARLRRSHDPYAQRGGRGRGGRGPQVGFADLRARRHGELH